MFLKFSEVYGVKHCNVLILSPNCFGSIVMCNILSPHCQPCKSSSVTAASSLIRCCSCRQQRTQTRTAYHRDPCNCRTRRELTGKNCRSTKKPSKDRLNLYRSFRPRWPRNSVIVTLKKSSSCSLTYVCFTQGSSIQEEVWGTRRAGAGEDVWFWEDEIVGTVV